MVRGPGRVVVMGLVKKVVDPEIEVAGEAGLQEMDGEKV